MSENWQRACSGSNLTVGGKWNFTLNQGATRSHRRVPYCYVVAILSSSLLLSSSIIFFSGLDELLFYEDSFSLSGRPIVSLISMHGLFSKRKHDCFFPFFSPASSSLIFCNLPTVAYRMCSNYGVYKIINESFEEWTRRSRNFQWRL